VVDIRPSVEQLGAEFEYSPVDFFTESDMQSRLSHLLRDEIERSDDSPLTPRSSTFGSEGMQVGSSSPYRADYDEWIKQQVDRVADTQSTPHLSRVHTEVWFMTDFGSDKKNRVDIAVLRSGDPPNYRPVSWIKGKQSLSFEMVDHAFELKYLRERIGLRRRVDDVDLQSASVNEITETLDLDFNGIGKDLNRLQGLSGGIDDGDGEAVGYTDLDSYFVLFANYDPLRRFQPARDNLPFSEVNHKIGKAIIQKIAIDFPDVNVFYATPAGYEWLKSHGIS
jgi:hypothetical protein